MSKHSFLDSIPLSPKQSTKEEIANAVTHGIGAVVAVAALVILVVRAARAGDTWKVVSFSIYGATMITLFLSSMIYHIVSGHYSKRFFRILDHTSIFLLIAGTYTPITIGTMRGGWGWTLFGLTWGLAVAGTLLKLFVIRNLKWLSLVIYLLMGWIGIVAIRPLLACVSKDFLVWILAGGFFYSFGTIFYVSRKMLYHHAIWHLFVLAGATCHFMAMLTLI